MMLCIPSIPSVNAYLFLRSSSSRVIIIHINRFLPSFSTLFSLIIEHTKVIQGVRMSQECVLQHMSSVFRCQFALTCGMSIIVSLCIPLFLAASVSRSYSIQASPHVSQGLSCPLAKSSCRFVIPSCDL